MSFCDKNMQKGRLKQHSREGETGNHPEHAPGLQKKAPVMSYRQPLCRVLPRWRLFHGRECEVRRAGFYQDGGCPGEVAKEGCERGVHSMESGRKRGCSSSSKGRSAAARVSVPVRGVLSAVAGGAGWETDMLHFAPSVVSDFNF